jgi:hypothetical protein
VMYAPPGIESLIVLPHQSLCCEGCQSPLFALPSRTAHGILESLAVQDQFLSAVDSGAAQSQYRCRGRMPEMEEGEVKKSVALNYLSVTCITIICVTIHSYSICDASITGTEHQVG